MTIDEDFELISENKSSDEESDSDTYDATTIGPIGLSSTTGGGLVIDNNIVEYTSISHSIGDYYKVERMVLSYNNKLEAKMKLENFMELFVEKVNLTRLTCFCNRFHVFWCAETDKVYFIKICNYKTTSS